MLLRRQTYRLGGFRSRVLLIPLCVVFALNATASDIELPLLKHSKALQCAQSESVAKVALSRFWDIQSNDLLIPFEGDDSSASSGNMHAATFDIILKTLVNTAERYPDLRNQVERTMLQWNYCDVFNDGAFYDLSHQQGTTQRNKVLYTSPEAWQGFKALGFLGDTERRFIPEIISHDHHDPRADYEQLFHRIYREQCFPHPDNAKLFDITEFGLPGKIAPTLTGEADEYLHYWETDCVYPRKAPELLTQLTIEEVPLLVPPLSTSLVVEAVPQLTPNLETKVSIVPVKQLVANLETKVSIAPVKQLVPSLQTEVEVLTVAELVPSLKTDVMLLDVAQLIPKLKSRVDLEVMKIQVPTLLSTVEIISVPLDIPRLATVLKLEALEVAIPKLQTTLELVDRSLNIPALSSYVEFSQHEPKVFTKPPVKQAPRPVVIASTRGRTGGFDGYHGNVGSVITPTVVATRPAPVMVQPVVQAQSTIVVDKNAPLLERLLSGLNSGNNVLIIDKIQLTINEYNGSVETAISSSDVGSTLRAPSVDKADLIKELVKFNSQESNPVPTVTVVKKQQYVNKSEVKAAPSQYIKVPMLESLLLVSPTVSSVPKMVVINQVKKSTVKVPRLKSRVVVSVKQTPTVSLKKKRYKPAQKQSSSKSAGSSLFVYKPYKSGNKASSEEKSVEQLLQEYADYEARRKAGRSSKKKIIKSSSEETELRLSNKTAPVTQTVKIQKDPEVVLMSKTPRQADKIHFIFADEVPDYVDSKQVTAVSTNTPSGLSVDAPLPYVIEENFINDQNAEIDKSKKGKAKKPEKKPIGLAGNVYLKQSLGSEKWGIGGSINRKIIKDDYWFARVGWSYSLEQGDDPFSYSWGIGYSDWHAGTFSAQLNNWGPIKMGEGLALDKAIASLGYSVKSELLKKYRLSLSGALNIPIDGNSSVAVNTRWSPIENWYLNASVSQPLEGGGDPKWSYGFGYSNWRPNKFNLQYSNYGPNTLFYHNYRKNGTWSLSYNWKF